MATSIQLVTWLRAVGEPTRLRLLALCAERDFSVSDLARALGQSEPRVSRHLKILCDAGLLVRLRQGQWVHYQAARAEAAGNFVQGLLAQLDRSDALLAHDRERGRAEAAVDGEAAQPKESRLGRSLRAFVESGRPAERLGSALVIGVDHLELLACAAALAQDCIAIAHSRRAAQVARAYAERQGFTCRVLLASAVEAQGGIDLPVSPESSASRKSKRGRTTHALDAVLIDHLADPARTLATLLALGRQSLTAAGHLWLFERYDALESPRERVVEHPLARMRRLLRDAGFECRRLNPIEADGEHVLAAAAVPLAGDASAASVA